MKIIKEYKNNLLAIISFIVFFLILFSPIMEGIGNFWDWVFPYFNNHISNYFFNNYLSWNNTNLGSTMSYSPDYYFRLIISLLGYTPFNPESILYWYLTLVFSLGAFGIFLICRKNNVSPILSWLLGLIVFINPALFYDLLGGFVNYFLSFVIFIYFFYFLFYFYKKDIKSTIIASLLFAFIGAQIQFFIMGGILLMIYFTINKEKFSIKYALLFFMIIFLINLPWLSNFLFGANSLSSISSNAEKVSFSDNSQQKIINIFNLSFSKATQIFRFYDINYQIFFTVFFMILLFLTILNKGNRNRLIVLTFFLVLAGLSTGYFNNFNLWPISLFYPIFRQVGHFSALIFFALIMLISMTKINKVLTRIITLLVIVFILINLPIYYNNYPSINFSDARAHFSLFNDFNRIDDSIYRNINYPFFYQDSFIDVSKKNISNFLVSNSGYDSFSMYSGKSYINSYVTPYSFNKSIQYQFMKSNYSVEILTKYNIKYLYDFSSFYESNFERFVPKEVYNNDLTLIKNDPDIINKILKNNGENVTLIEDHIIKINNVLARVNTNNLLFMQINPTKYVLYVLNISNNQDLSFLESYHKDWHIYLVKNPTGKWCNPIESYKTTETTECQSQEKFFQGEEFSYLWKQSIFDDTHKEVYDYANGWTIDPDYIKSHYSSDYYTTNPDGSINVQLVLYFKPQSYFYLGLILSITTLVLCIAYLIYDFRKKRSPKPEF